MADPIGVACAADPEDPSAFSGTPASVIGALRAAGEEVVPVAATLSEPRQRLAQLVLAGARVRPAQLRGPGDPEARLRAAVQTNQSRLLASTVLARVRGGAAARTLRRLPQPVRGCVQYGTHFELPAGVPFVTYDDMTVEQAIGSYPYSWVSRLTRSDLDAVIARQRRVFHSATACCTTSHWAARSIVEDYGVSADRVHVVGVGATNSAQRATGRDWATPRYVFVGKDWERKNGDAVVRAFARVRDGSPEATLDLVGGHPPIALPGVVGHGLLAPDDPATAGVIARLYAHATCFVLPSLHEPAGIAYIEAALTGVGSIGTASGGSSTLIGNGGLVVDPRDEEALLDAMQRFAEPAQARAFGDAAAARAELFTWDLVARRLRRALDGEGGPDFL